MAPISKENDVLTISADLSNPSRTPRPDDTAAHPQPVALEVPVTVNGARSVEGSDKREPFSETTKTVLVFGNGAVIRLGSPVAPGQLLFLTNEKTKKEVVCQVVKSKSYRSASGYVELEFTEPVVGFWGMRFPADRVAAPAPVRTAAPLVAAGNPAASAPPTQKPAPPVDSVSPKLSDPKPLPIQPAPLPIASQAPAAAATNLASPPAIPVVPAIQVAAPDTFSPSIQEPAVPHAAGVSSSLATSLANLLGEDEPETLPSLPKTPAPSAEQIEPVSSATNEAEALKQHTARLQEQLSSLLFAPTAGSKAKTQTPSEKTPETRPNASTVKQVLETAKPYAAPIIPALPSQPLPPPAKSSLDTEEVKIPSWLEPLARNAADPASTQELVEREKAKHISQTAAHQEAAEPSALPSVSEPESAPDADLPTIGNLLPLDEEVLKEDRPSGKSGKGMRLAAIAAAVLIAGGGAWYFLQPGSNSQKPAAVASAAVLPLRDATPSLPPASQPSPALNPQPNVRPVDASPAASLPASSASERPATPTETGPVPDVNESKPRANSQRNESAAAKSRASASEIPAAEKEAIRPVPVPESETAPAPKKPSLGEVHLASPLMNRPASQLAGNEAAPTLASGANVPQMGDSLNSALGAGGKDAASPAAPLPVGGDVTPAKLISSVSPMYPALAKSQHVSGDVVIDALIDTNGRVTTMKVISGPTLLHQAAKDALKQWKYRAATLDGNPVSMHLTVKLQFRMP